jgi:disulfide bond formation protein DsbB
MRLPSTLVLAGMVAGCLAAIVLVLVSQHVFDMQPCPWCVLQRLVVILIAVAAGIGLVWRSVAGRVVAGGFALALAVSGIAAALWQYFVASKSDSCALTLADHIMSGLRLDSLLPDVFAPRGNCAEASLPVFGIPYPVWSLALFVILAAAAAHVLAHRD